MRYENKIKEIFRKHLDKATEEIQELKDYDFSALWGDETINCMVDASFAVYHATMEGQQHSLDEGYTVIED